MPRLLLALSQERVAQSMIDAAHGMSGWMVEMAADPQEFWQLLRLADWDILGLDEATVSWIHAPEAPLAALIEPLCVVLLVALSRVGYEERLLRPQLHAVVPLSEGWIEQPDLMYGRLRLMANHWRSFKQERTSALLAQQRQEELEALAGLAVELGRAHEEARVIEGLLEGLLARSRDAAVAYLERVEPPAPQTAEISSDGLVFDSEVEDLGDRLRTGRTSSLIGASRAAPISEPGSGMLRLAAQRSHQEGLLACLPPRPHPSWESLLAQRQPTIFERRPVHGVFPGLEPLWHRLKRGFVALVPVWGAGAPLGVLIFAQLTLERGRSAWSAVSLQGIAAMVGGALEHVRQVQQASLAYDSLQSAQDKLVQTEKFAAVGHLAAQIAHEINNPSSFVISNLSVMRDYAEGLDAFERELGQAHPDPDALSASRAAHEVDFIHRDLRAIIDQCEAGMMRIRHIVQELRYFSHDSGPAMDWVHVERLLEASLALVRHEIRYRARVELSFAPCERLYSDANKLSQVFLNLLVNAAHALEHGDPERDVIYVGTVDLQDHVMVYVEDTGTGISKEDLPRIFDPFFTTRERGQGTGLGLSISRDILTSLDAQIRVASELGQGTRFELLLPKAPKAPKTPKTP